MKERKDNFHERRLHLQKLSDHELKTYFYELAGEIIDPLVELSYTHTTKSIERSVLLRMGFSSLGAKEIVDKLNEHNLLSKGAGHCVYRISIDKKVTLKKAGQMILEDSTIEYLQEVFKSNG